MMPYYLNELMMSGNYFAMRKCAILPLNLGGDETAYGSKF